MGSGTNEESRLISCPCEPLFEFSSPCNYFIPLTEKLVLLSSVTFPSCQILIWEEQTHPCSTSKWHTEQGHLLLV